MADRARGGAGPTPPGGPVRLRPHHLLCLLTYAGKGYSPAFVENFDRITARIAAGDPILLVEGPDDVCAPCAADAAAHCHGESVRARDAAAGAALAGHMGDLSPGQTLRLDGALLNRLRTAFASGTIRGACAGCEWSQLCTGIAAACFTGTRLRPATGQ